MKTLKKQLAIVITLAMLLGLMPVAAFADEYTGGTSGVTPFSIDDDLLPGDIVNGNDIVNGDGESLDDALEEGFEEVAEEVSISPAFIDFMPFSGVISDIPNDPSLGGYVVETGPMPLLVMPAWSSLKPGQIWTGKTVFYPQVEISPGVWVSDGTAIITVYIWGRPFAEGMSLIQLDEFGNAHIKLEAQIGDFKFDEFATGAYGDSTGGLSVDFLGVTGTPPTLQWEIDEAAITQDTGPLQIWYHLYLQEEPDWRVNYWYTTAGSYIEIKFQPNMNNPYYWTKYEETAAEFTAVINWNNGGGINSGTITDNILGKTISFGSNPTNQPPNQDVASVPWSNLTYRSLYWSNTATIRGETTPYWWHLNWTKGLPKIYYITVHGLIKDVDGTPIDVTYKLDLGRTGGNTAFAAGRYLVSESYFRRILDSDGIPFVWDADGNLVYRESLIAQIRLLDVRIPTGSLSITKNNVPSIPGAEWYFDGALWEFTVRVRATDTITGEYMYAILEPAGVNTFNFVGFDYIFRASTITLRQTSSSSQYSHTVTINGLPQYAAYGDANLLKYQIVEFFTFETLGLLDVLYQIDGSPALFAVATPTEYQSSEHGAFATIDFNISTPRNIMLRNIYEHGIGFIEINKLLDGFPADWGVDKETVFYVRIFDMDAGNYLWFFEHLLDPSHEPYLLPVHWSNEFLDTWWCVGNHEKGLTTVNFPDNIRPILELPITVWESIVTSNLWTGIQYDVREVARVDGVAASDTQAIWKEFWDLAVGTGTPNRAPIWIDAAWNSMYAGDLGTGGNVQIPIAMGENLQTWLEDSWIYNTALWEYVRPIEDGIDPITGFPALADTIWHSVPVDEWYWGVIYPTNDPEVGMFNPTLPLKFNQTENVTITNRYKFQCGTLELSKILGDNAEAWGMTPYTKFYAQVLTDETVPRALVFVPEPLGQDEVWRVIGFMGLDPNGIANVAYGYQVLCPVGGITPPDYATAQVAFSANKPVTLIEIPTFMFHGISEPLLIRYEIQYEIEEVFSGGIPVGFLEADFVLENITESFIITTPDAVEFPHLNTIDAVVTNNFIDPHGNLVISKKLAGYYESWDVDEETLFWAGVFRHGTRINFYNPKPFVFVYENYLGRDAFFTLFDLTSGPIVDEVSFSVEEAAVIVGLTTSTYLVPAEHPYDVVELRVNAARFSAEVGEIKRDGDNLFVTIENTFVQRPGGNGGGGNGGNGGGGTPPPDEKEPEQRTVEDFFVDEHIWYLRGYEDTTIRPNNSITRAEVSMAFYRLLRPEMKNITPSSPFSDVADDAWYGRGVSILAYYGIVTGYTDDLFKPNSPITRRELAAVVSRFDQLLETDENPYRDVSQNDWARKYILSATKRGWFVGYGGLFRPEAYLTRGEFATAVNRVLNRHILLEDIPDDIFNFPDLLTSHWAYTALIEAAHTHEYIRREDGINEIWTKIISTGLDAAYNE